MEEEERKRSKEATQERETTAEERGNDFMRERERERKLEINRNFIL